MDKEKNPNKLRYDRKADAYEAPVLQEVVIRLSYSQRRLLGMQMHHNPALFRKLMKEAKNDREQQTLFNLCFNAARDEAGRECVQYAFAIVGGISLIASGGSLAAAASPFLRQGALLTGSAFMQAGSFTARTAIQAGGAAARAYAQVSGMAASGVAVVEAASLRCYFAVGSAMIRFAPEVRSITNVTTQMLKQFITPINPTPKNMAISAITNYGAQLGSGTLLEYIQGKSLGEAIRQSRDNVNYVGVGSAALCLNPVLQSVLSASTEITNISYKTLWRGISLDQFAFNSVVNYGVGRAIDRVPGSSLPVREATVATGINMSTVNSRWVNSSMYSVWYSMRFTDKGISESLKLGIETAGNYVESMYPGPLEPTNNK